SSPLSKPGTYRLQDVSPGFESLRPDDPEFAGSMAYRATCLTMGCITAMTPFKKNSPADFALTEQKGNENVSANRPRSDGVSWRCPRCLTVLGAAENELKCLRCNTAYAKRDGIVDLRCRRHDYYFNPVPRQEMAALVRQAADATWDESVARFLRHVRKVGDWVDNIAVNGRYAWKLFLEL